MKIYRSFPISCLLASLALQGTVGCHRHTANPSVAVTNASVKRKKPVNEPPPPLTPEQLKLARPNEAGVVPILEYHNIRQGTPHQVKAGTFRTAEQFRGDLKKLYDEGFLPVSMSEYLDNKMDLPYGKSPIIFTFDDATPTQFKYLPDGSIDPDCALGILQAFHKEHPDFAVKATFFVLPLTQGFGPKDLTAQKLKALLAMGCEIGNHTLHHPNLRRLSDDKVQEEIASCADMVEKMVPGTRIDTFALPMGVAPRNKKLSLAGEWNGIKYSNRAVFLAGAEPARAVISKRFDPLRIPRVLAVEGENGVIFWLDRLKESGTGRYISDGDPNITTIPKNLESRIDKSKLNGSQLRTYVDYSE